MGYSLLYHSKEFFQLVLTAQSLICMKYFAAFWLIQLTDLYKFASANILYIF